MGSAVASIRERLLKERQALLDLSTRNRLLNVPLRTKNNRSIEIVDEKASQVFGLLIEGKAFSFSAGVELSEAEKAELDPDDDVTGGIPQPEGDTFDQRGVASRHSDARLQTKLTSQGLQKRLFDVWYDAQTLEQEQGVNVLYLAFGLLRWFDSDSSDMERHSPLVLLPVRLERTTAADRFKLRWREEPPSWNLTLQAKMNAEFGLAIEGFADEEEVNLDDYFSQIAETVARQKRWQVLPDSMVLGFFSFSKFLMYRDLDPDNWPNETGIDTRDNIVALLQDGFRGSEPIIPEDAPIDDVIRPVELHHVVDADSSQTVVIAEAANGRSIVVKGPPGTGKSQTITNIIAAAAARGKRVLFVAEKMAALEVVHRRLQQVGLGPLTLELHSNKSNKRAVLEELKRTRDARLRPRSSDPKVVQRLEESVSALNDFARRLHERIPPTGLTPQAILGRLVHAYSANAPEGFELVGAEAWDQETVGRCRLQVREVSDRLSRLGSIPGHVWRGAQCDPMDPIERAQLSRRLQSAIELYGTIVANAKIAAEQLAAPIPLTIADMHDVLKRLQTVPLPIGLDRKALTDPGWSRRDGLTGLIASGRAHVTAAADVRTVFNQVGHNADYTHIRKELVTQGASLFRFLSGEYRRQLALLRSYLVDPLPRGQGPRLALVDRIIGAQKAKAAFAAAEKHASAFGHAWKGALSDWNELEGIVAWRVRHETLPQSIWSALATTTMLDELASATELFARSLPAFETAITEIVAELKLDVRRAFGVDNLRSLPLKPLAERLGLWNADLEGLSHFAAFAAQGRRLAGLGAASLIEGVHDGLLDHVSLMPAFERAYADSLRRVLFGHWPELRGFDGEGHNKAIERFREFDKERIRLAQEEIVAAHAEGRPSGSMGLGPLGVLNAEIAKKRSHLPIRVLLERAGPAIQQLKPVFMMSPLSVAQFLKPGGLEFDLLVMDEASQIEPVDALGAVARARQIVVVGDEKQLPPTAFFRKLTGDDDGEEPDDEVPLQVRDAESILELCLAKGLPARMLEWHYRSRHQSLIAVSNREFYENRLFIVPSPYDAVAGMGLKFNLLTHTAYDRGGTRSNPGEAKAIAEAVILHARNHPEQTLGVATFSVAQRQAIQKELELLRRANSDLESFFSDGVQEPFFVKNLENIQGDERDVIFISVGYGKTAEGYLAHNFGPLSGEGGERRLNVLISRAKTRCEVFCNFTGADIDLERSSARGVACLKLFLTFAETGRFGLGEVTGLDFDSEFEEKVCERLQSEGYIVKRQIGASGFRVDLAIADPDRPGRFILGIECDGAQYHSSRSARDRDRLRQQVLETQGWIIHRVWSADWYLRPDGEMKKIRDALIVARAEWVERDERGKVQIRTTPVSFEGEADKDIDIVYTGLQESPAAYTGVAYVQANFSINSSTEPHQVPIAEMTRHVVRVVETEGPVHVDEIVSRIRTLWGYSRAGSRMRGAVDKAVKAALQAKHIEGNAFLRIPGREILIRDRSQVESGGLRRPEMLPPEEIERAVMTLIDSNFGATREELVTATARTFGFQSTSTQLRAVIEGGIDNLLAQGTLTARGDFLALRDQTSRASAS